MYPLSFKDYDGYSKLYSIGYFTNKDKEPVMFFIDEIFDFNLLVQKCFDSLLVNKYNNYIFYIHNFSNFDVLFLYNIFNNINMKLGYEHYKIKNTMRDQDIIKLDLYKSINNKEDEDKSTKTQYFKISLRDSRDFLKNSLDYLTKELNVSNKKGIFP